MILQPIVYGTLVRRYKRFLVDVQLDNPDRLITAHCANPGAMLGLVKPGNQVILSLSQNPKRKLPYTLQAIQTEGVWVGANTHLANELLAESLATNSIPELSCYPHIQREVKYGKNCRIDFLLSAPGLPDCYVEVKNVHLKRKSQAEFPDCMTARGTKHLTELATLVEQGHRCVVVYVVQRHDCTGFQVANDLDPSYAKASQTAQDKGVETLAFSYQILPLQGVLTLGLYAVLPCAA